MKIAIVLSIFVFVLSGCASHTRTVKQYDLPISHAAHIYKIDVLVDLTIKGKDSVHSFFKIYSLMRPNGFWYYTDSVGNVAFMYYIQDVRGKDYYIPTDLVILMHVHQYEPTDVEYDLERHEMLLYYEGKDF